MQLETLLSNLVHPLRNAPAYQQMRDAAIRDPLTGLLNRAGLTSALTREVQLSVRHSTALCVSLMSIDHFKRVNDSYGHLVGDSVLQEVADRLLE